MRPIALPLREQAMRRDEWLHARLDDLLPRIMRRRGIDCWVVVGREYNEDPILRTMLPGSWLSARRRTILVFTDYGANRVAVSRYPVGDLFAPIWSPEDNPDQLSSLADYLQRVDPRHIALNTSPVFPVADGLSATEHAALLARLPAPLVDRVVSAEPLAVGWLEARLPAELARYPETCAISHHFLDRALSAEVIQPAATTTGDVAWWLREETASAGYGTWFHPTVSVQRIGGDTRASGEDVTILPGDLVHIDFGIVDLGLHTDQQRHAYVLRRGEIAAPAGLTAALRLGNDAQDALLAEFAAGRTGNEILAAGRARLEAAGIEGTIYSHPIGLHGHGAGPTIGLWDQQDGVPGPGDYTLLPATTYAIELGIAAPVAEWEGRVVRIMLEEDAGFDGEEATFLDGRQTELRLI
jgi:Xaa-Pro aminopeptidase